MAIETASGRYGFSTLSTSFTNTWDGSVNFRVVTFLNSIQGGDRYGYESDVVAVNYGKTFCFWRNSHAGEIVTFRVFRQDYATDGTSTETKVLDESQEAPFSPLGPR